MKNNPYNISNSNASPSAFSTSYDVRRWIELFDIQDRGILKYLVKLMNIWIPTVLLQGAFINGEEQR